MKEVQSRQKGKRDINSRKEDYRRKGTLKELQKEKRNKK